MFGIIISLVCPVMFVIQNTLFGLVLNYQSIYEGDMARVLRHLFKKMRYQLVVIIDNSMFIFGLDDNKENRTLKTYETNISFVVAYIVYITLPVGLFILYAFARTNTILCSPLEVPFLLNNSITPANNLSLSELYRQRQAYGHLNGDVTAEPINWGGERYSAGRWSEKIKAEENRGKFGLLWNAKTDNFYYNGTQDHRCYRRLNYWKLNNLKDLIDQFNYVGFHDICNYPTKPDFIEYRKCPGITNKNQISMTYLYPGYRRKNSTGMV